MQACSTRAPVPSDPMTPSRFALLCATAVEAFGLALFAVAESPAESAAIAPVVFALGLVSPAVFLGAWMVGGMASGLGRLLRKRPDATPRSAVQRLVSLLLSAVLAVLFAVAAFALAVFVLVPGIDHPNAAPGARLLGLFASLTPVVVHGLWMPILGGLWGVELGELLTRLVWWPLRRSAD